MKRPRHALLFPWIASLPLLLVGCNEISRITGVGGAAPWNVPTTIAFADTTDEDIAAVEDLLNTQDVAWRRRSGTTPSYVVTGIKDTKELGRLLNDIRDVLTRKDGDRRAESFFANAALGYSSLRAAGQAATNATVQVTPGANAYIADGPVDRPWRAIPVNADGRWTGEVDTSQAVAANDGWLYIAAYAYGRYTWSRVNVLTGVREGNIPAVPFDAPLPQTPPTHDRPGGSAQGDAATMPPKTKAKPSLFDQLFG